MSIASVRADLAEAVNAADLGFTCNDRPLRQARPGDAWVTVSAVRPAPGALRTNEADFSVVFLASADSDSARGETALDESAGAILDVLSTFPASGLTLEPATVLVANSAFLALVVSLTTEV